MKYCFETATRRICSTTITLDLQGKECKLLSSTLSLQSVITFPATLSNVLLTFIHKHSKCYDSTLTRQAMYV